MVGVSQESRSEKVRYWQELIEEQRRSGLAVSAFCKERNISAASFYQWRTKLQQQSTTVTTLLPVKLVGPSEQLRTASRGCIQVLTPSGVSLTISGETCEADLVKVLRAINVFEANRSC